ncbi:MAG TPA: MFS transporter [Acidimicrobiales bacterium]|nr:MFS transporter [Acidimicrobiales bacterium]
MATTTNGMLRPTPVVSDSYKWTALTCTTLGVLMATIDGSIVLIALPDIFRGIQLDPLTPGNSFYLLWMILGFLVVTSVLVVSLGRLGDIYGRVRTYNLGFAVFTFFSLLLSITWLTGPAGGMWLIIMRLFQGVGAAMLFANSSAILTDAFPVTQRGLALGINQAAAISGSFVGLVLGGILAPINWRLVFLVSVPIGLFATVWGYLKLVELGERHPAKIDWAGNVTFALGLVLVMIGITYGIEPHGGHTMGWTSPAVISELAAGIALLVGFVVIETRVPEPMFKPALFRIRAFTAGVVASFLAALGRGGLMFLLIIWLQGIWLPLHGYSFASTPLWAGIYMLPLTCGFLIAGPVAGILSDRFGSREFATAGMLGTALAFVLFLLLPVNFSYPEFALILFFAGISSGCFVAPNRAAVMNSLPAADRGAGAGMNTTFQNSAQVLSIGIYFSLIIVGLSSALHITLLHGLTRQGVPVPVATGVSHLPPVSTLFAAFLGYNPIQHILGPTVISHISAAHQHALLGHGFFPGLISGPFRTGLEAAFIFSIATCLVAAAASWNRGSKYVHVDTTSLVPHLVSEEDDEEPELELATGNGERLGPVSLRAQGGGGS